LERPGRRLAAGGSPCGACSARGGVEHRRCLLGAAKSSAFSLGPYELFGRCAQLVRAG
jgi:hypothetical protein